MNTEFANVLVETDEANMLSTIRPRVSRAGQSFLLINGAENFGEDFDPAHDDHEETAK